MLNKALQELYHLKEQTGLTNRQIADLSGVPESTVGRILRKETADPRYETVCRMVDAMKEYIEQNKPHSVEAAGNDMSETSDTDPEQMPSAIPASANDGKDITQVYERQIANQHEQILDLQQQNERLRGSISALSHQNTITRRRYMIALLVAACAITFIITLFSYDFLHPGRGWLMW